MAKVVVRLYSTLKDIAKSGRIELEAVNLRDALDWLALKFGSKFSDTLYDSEKLKNGEKVVRNCFTLVVNSEMIGLKHLEKKELKEGDMVHIFPPIAGGTEVKK